MLVPYLSPPAFRRTDLHKGAPFGAGVHDVKLILLLGYPVALDGAFVGENPSINGLELGGTPMTKRKMSFGDLAIGCVICRYWILGFSMMNNQVLENPLTSSLILKFA